MNAAPFNHHFTSIQDPGAEALLQDQLSQLQQQCAPFRDTISVFLGGSYGRGEGGVIRDSQTCKPYNDLDLFVFAPEWKLPKARALRPQLQQLGAACGNRLGIDVDFSQAKGYLELYRHGQRLIYQELKHGSLCLVGKPDFLKAIPERPPEALPWTEACRLLLNRGMGLLFAAEQLQHKQPDTGFIARNLNKLILGCADALLISRHLYSWSWQQRQERLEHLLAPEAWLRYQEACLFKRQPHNRLPDNPDKTFHTLQALFTATVEQVAGNADARQGLVDRAREQRLCSPINALRFAVKTHCAHVAADSTLPPVVRLLRDLYNLFITSTDGYPQRNSALCQAWQIFN